MLDVTYPSSVAMVARLESVYEATGEDMLRDAAELLQAAIVDADLWRERVLASTSPAEFPAPVTPERTNPTEGFVK